MTQQDTRSVPFLSANGAWRVLLAAQREAIALRSPVAICITDAFGHVIVQLRMDGAPIISIDLSTAKARTAAYLKVTSASVQALVDSGSPSILACGDIMPLAGGVPIFADEVIVGAVGVSGADGDKDERIALAGVRCLSEPA